MIDPVRRDAIRMRAQQRYARARELLRVVWDVEHRDRLRLAASMIADVSPMFLESTVTNKSSVGENGWLDAAEAYLSAGDDLLREVEADMAKAAPTRSSV
jgi:hypothetical protein